MNEKINNQENKEKMSLKSILAWIGIYVLVFAIFLMGSLFCVRAFDKNYRYYPVKGTSMQPTINPDVPFQDATTPDDQLVQDGVFIKVTTDVVSNDIVIIKKNSVENTTIIKRVIATGGDKVTIAINNFENNIEKDGEFVPDNLYHVFVVRNGETQIEMLEEDYVDDLDKQIWTMRHGYKTSTLNNSWEGFKYEETFYKTYFGYSSNLQIKTCEYNGQLMLFYELAEDEIFYLGDHRDVSQDGRHNGVARRKDIVGRVISIIRNAKKLDEEGKLWLIKLKTMFSYYWSSIVDYFAWG